MNLNAETMELINEQTRNAISQAVKKGVQVDKIRESVDPKYWPYIDESVALDLSTRKEMTPLGFGRRSKRRSKRRTRKSRKSKKRKSKKAKRSKRSTRKRSVKRKRSKK